MSIFILNEMENQKLSNKLPYVDTEALEYVPQLIKRGDGRETDRVIFGLYFDDPNMKYSVFERELLSELDQSWEESRDPLLSTNIEETQKMRFLQGCHWDVTTACKSINEYVRWYSTRLHGPISPPDRAHPDTWLYFYGRDRSFRPILMIDCMRLQVMYQKAVSKTFIIDTLLEVMEFFVRYLAVPGKIEQLLVIANLGGCSIWNPPLNVCRDCVGTLTTKFRGRLSKLLIVNTPLVFYTLWQVLKPFLPERTASKVSILHLEFMRELEALIDNDDIDPILMKMG